MNTLPLFARIACATLLFAAFAASPALAQNRRIEQLSKQLEKVQAELDQLKKRDHERSAWEANVMERLPDPDAVEDVIPGDHPPFPTEIANQEGLDTDEEDDDEIERFLTPVVTDCGNITFKPGCRVQSRYIYDDGTNNNDFFIRRFRMKMGGNAFDLANYYLELKIDSTARYNTDPTPDPVVENAWLDFHLLNETHYLRVGLYDVPFSRNALTSDSKLLFMDRTLIYGELAGEGVADNGVGLLFHGRPLCGRVEYSVGIFDNSDFELDPNAVNPQFSNNLMPVGRVVLHLLDPATPGSGYADYRESYIGEGQRLAIGANSAYLSRATDTRFAAGTDVFDIHACGVDVFFNSGPFVFQAEYDRYEQHVLGAANRYSDGWYAQAGYIIHDPRCCCPCHPVIELAVRYEELDDRSNAFGNGDYLEYTSVGMNFYIREHNLKIQTDYTWRDERVTPVDNDRFQVQLQFDY